MILSYTPKHMPNQYVLLRSSFVHIYIERINMHIDDAGRACW